MKKYIVGIGIAVAALGLGATVAFATVNPVTAATGGEAISIDTTSASGGSNTFTTPITGPVITEASVGDIGAGTYVLTLPAGWVFDTGATVTISLNGGTDIDASSTATVGSNTLTFGVLTPSSGASAVLTFNGIAVKPTGTATSTGNMLISSDDGGSIVGVDGSTNFGTFGTVPGALTSITVSPDGNTITADQTQLFAAEGFDQFANSRGDVTGGTTFTVSSGSMFGSFTGATFQPASTSPSITVHGAHADTAGDDAAITVTPGVATTVAITTQPANTNGTVDNPLQQQPIIHVTDQFNNDVADGTAVTASVVSGTGPALRNTATTTLGAGVATFTTLGYNKAAEPFTLKFSSNSNDSDTSDTVSALIYGVPHHLAYDVQPSNVRVNTAITPAVKVSIRDQYDNTRTGQNGTGVSVYAVTPQGKKISVSGGGSTTISGVATFSSIMLNQPGGYVLGAHTFGLSDILSVPFNVAPATKGKK